jgi:hypothetical protein
MRVQIPSSNRPPRWVRHAAGSLMLFVFFANPAVQARVSSVACTFVHSVKVIKKFDDTIGLRNIIQFS